MPQPKRYVSLLRGINVGQSNRITSDELIQAYSKLPVSKIQVHIQSGNVIFDSALSVKLLSDQIKNTLKKNAGIHVSVVVLAVQKLKLLASQNPFAREAKNDPSRVHLGFLAEPTTRAAIRELSTRSAEPNEFKIGTQVIYLFTPNGMGKAKLPPFEKILGVPVTFRNARVTENLIQLALEK